MNVTLYKKGDKLFYYALYKFFYRRHRDRLCSLQIYLLNNDYHFPFVGDSDDI